MRDVMTGAVITVAPNTTVRTMARLMLDHRIGAVLVVDPRADRLVGVVSESDLVAKLAFGADVPGDLALIWEASTGKGAEWVQRAVGLTAADLMSADVICTTPEASMAEAARIMLSRRVQHLPVVADGRVVGIVGRSDLLRPFERSDAQVRAEVGACVSGFAPGSATGPSVAVQDGVVVISSGGFHPRELTELQSRLAALPGVAGVRVAGTPTAASGEHHGLA